MEAKPIQIWSVQILRFTEFEGFVYRRHSNCGNVGDGKYKGNTRATDESNGIGILTACASRSKEIRCFYLNYKFLQFLEEFKDNHYVTKSQIVRISLSYPLLGLR